MPVIKVCVVCGADFKVPPVRAKSAKTCSRKCQGVLSAAKYSEARHKSNCQHCGKLIEVSSGRADRGNGRFCSKACYYGSIKGKRFTPIAEDGTTTGHSDGYVLERSGCHPFAVKGYVLQHRLVMERWMRESCSGHPFLVSIEGVEYLDRIVHVHHKNEIKNDNRRANLVACTPAAHRDIHDGRATMDGEVWPEPKQAVIFAPRKVERQCLTCGKHFVAKRSDVDRGGAKYCSKACLYKRPGESTALVDRTCIVCGTGFTVYRSSVLRGGAKFCSNLCRHEGRKGAPPSHISKYP